MNSDLTTKKKISEYQIEDIKEILLDAGFNSIDIDKINEEIKEDLKFN